MDGSPTSVFGYHRWGYPDHAMRLTPAKGGVRFAPVGYQPVSGSNGSCLNASGTLSHRRDTPEALPEAITFWSGSCGLARCHVITIFDMRQQYANGIPLAERVEYVPSRTGLWATHRA